MEQVHPERNEGSIEQPSKAAAVKQKWNNYVESATLHGMQHVFSSPSSFRRIVWALFLLSGIGYFSFQCTVLVKMYFSHPFNTKVTLKHESSLDFPAVTICNFNLLRQSFVDERDFNDVVKYAFRDKIPDPLRVNPSAIDWSKHENLNMTEVYASGGHQITDMLSRCWWIGEDCTWHNFTPVLTSMGLCYTFNSGKHGREILKVSSSGAKSGLRLRLMVQQNDYYGWVSEQAGLKVLVHHHETPPMVMELGFAVGPGSGTFVAVRKEKVRNLKAPFESNCTDSPISSFPGYTRYTKSACLLTCHARHQVERCGCKDVKLPLVDNSEECSVRKAAECLFRENENYYVDISNKCNCSEPCETTTFKPSLSYANYPSEKLLEETIKLGELDGVVSEERKEAERKWLSQNELELNVYFQDLEVLHTEQQQAYGTESLLGEIGGQLGLCIGASLLSLLELCDVILSIIKIRLGFTG